MTRELYITNQYCLNNPTWHVEHSSWKAKHIRTMLDRHGIKPGTVCEIGCGAGEVLAQLQSAMDKDCSFHGYDISPGALDLCRQRQNENLSFKLGDVLTERGSFFDLVLMIDVIEHMENPFEFLRQIKGKGRYKLLHIPMDLCVKNLIRQHNLEDYRKNCGHIHFFCKKTSLDLLEQTGHEVIDCFFTPTFIDFPADKLSFRLENGIRRLLFPLNEDFTVTLLGGYSLMVLTR